MDDRRHPSDLLAFIGLALGVILLLLAVFTAYGSLLTMVAACEYVDTEACERKDLATAALVVAIVGLLPALMFLINAGLGRIRRALTWLAIGLLTYLAWAVLSDAATHG